MRLFKKFTAAAVLGLAILGAGALDTSAQSRKELEKQRKKYEKQQDKIRKQIEKENARIERERDRIFGSGANNGGVIYDNRGSYNNPGIYDNRGTYDNRGRVYDNRGTYDNRGRVYDNRGTYDNRGRVYDRGRAGVSNNSAAGYQQGFLAGQSDRRRGKYNESNVYRGTGTAPYQGDPNSQDYIYRQGFLQGYQDGYYGRDNY